MSPFPRSFSLWFMDLETIFNYLPGTAAWSGADSELDRCSVQPSWGFIAMCCVEWPPIPRVKGRVSVIRGTNAFGSACARTQPPSCTPAPARFLSAPHPAHQSDYYKGHIRRKVFQWEKSLWMWWCLKAFSLLGNKGSLISLRIYAQRRIAMMKIHPGADRTAHVRAWCCFASILTSSLGLGAQFPRLKLLCKVVLQSKEGLPCLCGRPRRSDPGSSGRYYTSTHSG